MILSATEDATDKVNGTVAGISRLNYGAAG
jgi:hypothetical protein